MPTTELGAGRAPGTENKLAEELGRPFPATELEWRIQRAGVGSGGDIWAIAVCYVTARAIMDRLDAVVGPTRWRTSYEKGPAGGVLCGLSILVENEWVTKFDGADNSRNKGGDDDGGNDMAVKGGLSSALKRAAVHWGIGRYLYNIPSKFAKVSDHGKERGTTKSKDGSRVTYRWDPPDLPEWALPPAPVEAEERSAPKVEPRREEPKRERPTSRDPNEPAPVSLPPGVGTKGPGPSGPWSKSSAGPGKPAGV